MKKTWEDAVDYCRERNWDLVSVSNEKMQVWAELEAMKADTPFVWLGLRYTCVLEFWFWISDEYFGFKHWKGNDITTECDMSGAMEKTGDHRWFSQPDTEEFEFICDM
ncbi:hypothetical protein LDENG_00075420 [Lucifuga dentata]|nr:hypothetical protein LDENG_00075420 [Lucifuga dentata]